MVFDESIASRFNYVGIKILIEHEYTGLNFLKSFYFQGNISYEVGINFKILIFFTHFKITKLNISVSIGKNKSCKTSALSTTMNGNEIWSLNRKPLRS